MPRPSLDLAASLRAVLARLVIAHGTERTDHPTGRQGVHESGEQLHVRSSGRACVMSFVLAIALGACGGDGDDPGETVQTYFRALADGDGKTACDQLTGDLERQALAYLAELLPEFQATSCEEALDELAENLGGDEADVLRDAKIVDTQEDGDTATVEVEGATSDAQLTKSGGRWYISGGLFE